jgi:hypothetical protein
MAIKPLGRNITHAGGRKFSGYGATRFMDLMLSLLMDHRV